MHFGMSLYVTVQLYYMIKSLAPLSEDALLIN